MFDNHYAGIQTVAIDHWDQICQSLLLTNMESKVIVLQHEGSSAINFANTTELVVIPVNLHAGSILEC